jgi:endoglucanase
VTENPTEQNRTANITLTGNGQIARLAVVQNATYVDPLGWISAEDAGNAMKIGLNLYNTMEAYGTWFDWTDDPIETFQTCWGNPLVTADWFNAVKANGFNAVRIPVTWFPHTDENFQVTEKWMNRVEEVVKYGLDAGLYVILNVHHDTGGEWLAADLSNIDEISEKYVNLWTQIATRFEKYDDHLMFESYNEILDENKQWANAKGDAFIAVNQLAQTFVNTIRSLGENNQHRNLIVNTYAANGSHEMLDPFVIPTDQIPEHLMVQVHNYDPAAFCKMTQELKDGEELPVWTEEFQNELAEELDILIEYYNANHVPIIIGEFAANDKIAEEERAKYAEFMVTYCRSNANISLFYWNEIISRTTFQPTYPTLMNALLKAKDY